MAGTPTPTVGSGSIDVYGTAYAEGFKSGSDLAQLKAYEDETHPNDPQCKDPGPLDQGEAADRAREYVEGIARKYESAFEAGIKAGYVDGRNLIRKKKGLDPIF